MLPVAIYEVCFHLQLKLHMHCNHDLIIVCNSASTYHIFQCSENVVTDGGEIWTVCWMGEKLIFQFSYFFSGCCCPVMSIVMMQNISFCQNFSVVTVNSGFQLLFKHSTILCTLDRLSMILVVLENVPIKVAKQYQHHFPSRRHTFECLGPGSHSLLWHYLQVHSGSPCFVACDSSLHKSLSFMISLQKLHAHFHTCPFVLIFKLLLYPLAQILWDPRSLWVVEYADPQLMPSLIGCTSDSNVSVLLNQNINLFNIVWCS